MRHLDFHLVGIAFPMTREHVDPGTKTHFRMYYLEWKRQSRSMRALPWKGTLASNTPRHRRPAAATVWHNGKEGRCGPKMPRLRMVGTPPGSLRPCLLLRFFWVERGNYRPTSKSRNFPNGPFTSQVYLGDIPAHPRISQPAKPYLRVFSATSRPPCFLSWKGGEGGDDGNRRRQRQERRRRRQGDGGGQSTTAPTRSSSGDLSPVSHRAPSPFPLFPRVSWCRRRPRRSSGTEVRGLRARREGREQHFWCREGLGWRKGGWRGRHRHRHLLLQMVEPNVFGSLACIYHIVFSVRGICSPIWQPCIVW
jgi:hypothetical protein